MNPGIDFFKIYDIIRLESVLIEEWGYLTPLKMMLHEKLNLKLIKVEINIKGRIKTIEIPFF